MEGNYSKTENYIIKIPEKCFEGTDEADRCCYTWKNLYIPYYLNKNIWKKFGKITLVRVGKGFGFWFGKDDDCCKISGDIVFNFGKGKKIPKYEYYEKLIIQDFSDNGKQKNYYLNQLEKCWEANYSLNNCSLMPCTAGMNNFKGGLDLDRFDKYIYYMNQFFNNRNLDQDIFSRAQAKQSKSGSAEENKNKLKLTLFNFLNLFNDVYEYCKYMYLIDSIGYVDKLIESGEREIKSGKDVVRYMELAESYWKMKGERMKNIFKINTESLV